MQPEARISQSIRNLIIHRGGFAFKVWGSERMMAGLPDIIGCYHGLIIGVETKTPEGKGPSARQRYVHKRMRAAGAIVVVARTVRDVSNVLDAMDDASGRVRAATAGLRATFAHADG